MRKILQNHSNKSYRSHRDTHFFLRVIVFEKISDTSDEM